MSDPPRRWPPHNGGSNNNNNDDPIKPTGGGPPLKRPRSDGRDTSNAGGNGGNASSQEAAAAAAAAADQAAQRPPTISDLRRANAQRWEEVVRLREMLLGRQSRRRRRRRQQDDIDADATGINSSGGGDASISATSTQQSSSALGSAQNGSRTASSSAAADGDGDGNLRQVDALDRQLAAYRSELALLLPPSSSDGAAAAAASTGAASTGTGTASADEQQQQQQQQHERNVQSILAHRAVINNARIHHSRIFGNEIIETHDGLVQVNAHLDRTIGQQQPQQQQNEAGHQHEIGSNGASLAVNEGGAAMSLSLHDRIVEAEGRVEEHRLVHAALVDMLERRGQAMNDATSGGSNGDTGTAVSEGNRTAQGHQEVATASADGDNDIRTIAENEARSLRSNLTYFAQQLDAHLDQMERVAATSVLEAREGDVLSDEEDAVVNIGSNNNVRSTSASTSTSSQQQPFLTSLFTNLSRRLVSTRDDPYVSVEAAIGAGGSNSSRSSSRNRRIERRRRIIDHLLNSGLLICQPDNPDLVRFIDYLE